MRSTSRRRRINVRPSASPANAEHNHFLKYILPEAIHGDKIRIPEEFTRRFGKELSSEIKITVPDGLVWKMELEKTVGEVWICNGWQEFKKYYSISHGFSLVFKYEGNSNFCVLIIDMSAAEIYYPCKNQSCNAEPNFESHNSETECPRNRHSLSHSGYNTRRKNQNLEKLEVIDVARVSVPSLSKSGTNVSSNPNDNSRKHGKDRSRQGYTSRMEWKLRKKQKDIEVAKKFKRTDPSFTVMIKPSNLIHCYMDVPASFAHAYMRKLDSVTVKLQESTGNGQQWEVFCTKHSSSSMRMFRGWIGFARDNNLRVGDVCVFELINRKSIVLKFTIFPELRT